MENKSTYWLSYTPTEKFNLIELAHTQRAISNFVKILTKKDIPVEFFQNNDGDSLTNGKKITISSTINMHNIDSVVGLALHEGAHCIYTDFKVLKKLANRLLEKNLMGGRRWIEALLNFIEDRRIDNLVYNKAPGYQNYYRSMYERYFYSKTVNQGLKGKEYREENWESYMFRIINMFNKNADPTALQILPTIYKTVDLKNINRLKNTKDSLELAIVIYQLIDMHFILNPSNKHQTQENRKNAKHNKTSKEEIKKAFSKQENFLKGQISKTSLTKKEQKQVKAIGKSNINIKDIKVLETSCPVHVIKGITPTIIESNLYNTFYLNDLKHRSQVEDGIKIGKKLLHKLRIRNEQITLASKRLKTGKIDPRRIYAANFEDDLFYKIDRSNYKPISLHVSIDGSGSMEGTKWQQVLTNTIALGYVALKMDNIDLTISIRTSGVNPNLSSKTAHIPLLILAFDSKKHTLKDLKRLAYYKAKGLTPEGMCLNALNEYIPNSSYYLDSYLINMSDGYPTFEATKGLKYKGKDAILDTAKAVKNIKKKGVKILSYFIQSKTTVFKEKELNENFQIMYGKEASFIDSKNINEVTKTLNNLFLEKNLVS
jgi:predicted peroxiredoxin